MLSLLLVGISLLGCAIPANAEKIERAPSTASLALVAAVLNAHIKVSSEDTETNESELGRQLRRVFDDHTASGTDALALLLGLYIGESSGEDVSCELVNRGKSVIPRLHYYSLHEVNIPNVQMSRVHRIPGEYSIVEQRIAKGEHCIVEK